MAKVAFLGLGVMGYPMAGHLKNKGGHDVTVYNRNAAKADKWVAQFGGKKAATPKEAAAGQDFVMMCVGNDNDVREVALGANGAFDGMGKGTVFVDHTTASAEIARTLYAEAKKRGFDFIDAPVSGGQAGAENGALTVMCGGDPGPYDRAEKVIAAYARMCKLLGNSGSGQLAKMVNQICIAGLVAGSRRRHPLREESRPRHRGADRHHLQGRGAVVADGEPLQDHGGGQVRLRLRGRLDAQGPEHLPRRSAAERRKPSGRGPGRSVLRRGAEDGRQPLGHVVTDRPPRSVNLCRFLRQGTLSATGRRV